MALISRYNPPPNWPPPPVGWTPPPGWQPDAAWGPPPEGWQLWTSERANPRAWGLAMLSALSWYVVFLVIALIGSRGGIGAEGAGTLLGPPLFSGVITGTIAWTRRSRWPVWVYPLVVLGIAIVLSAVSNVGRMSSGG